MDLVGGHLLGELSDGVGTSFTDQTLKIVFKLAAVKGLGRGILLLRLLLLVVGVVGLLWLLLQAGEGHLLLLHLWQDLVERGDCFKVLVLSRERRLGLEAALLLMLCDEIILLLLAQDSPSHQRRPGHLEHGSVGIPGIILSRLLLLLHRRQRHVPWHQPRRDHTEASGR